MASDNDRPGKLSAFRQQYPQYKDMSDDALASALHQKFYSDVPADQFRQQLGLPPDQASPASSDQPDDPSFGERLSSLIPGGEPKGLPGMKELPADKQPQREIRPDTQAATDSMRDERSYSGGDLTKDLGLSGARAVNTFAETAVELGDLIQRNNPVLKMTDAGIKAATGYDIAKSRSALTQGLRDRFKQTSEIYDEAASDEFKRQKKALGDAEGFVGSAEATIKNPLMMADMAITSAPFMLGMAAPVRAVFSRATERAIAQGATQEAARKAGQKAAEKAAILSSAGVGAASGASQARQQVMEMQQAEIEKSPVYRELVGSGLDDKAARQQIADSAANYAGIVSGVISGAAGKLTAGVESRLFTGMVGKAGGPAGFALKVGKVGGLEAGEEAIQEGGEQFSANVGALFSGANENQSLMAGVPEAAGPGAVLGAITGAGMAASGQVAGLARGEGDGDPASDEEPSPESGPEAPQEPSPAGEPGEKLSPDPEAPQETSPAGEPVVDTDAALEKSIRGERTTGREKQALIDAGYIKRAENGRIRSLPAGRRRINELMEGRNQNAEGIRAVADSGAWKQTQKAFYDDPRNQGLDHQDIVEQALEDGLPVPAWTLADYPDLVRRRQQEAGAPSGAGESAAPLPPDKQAPTSEDQSVGQGGDSLTPDQIAERAREAAASGEPSIDEAASEAATSPDNDLPEPSHAQSEAENFRMGHRKVAGMNVTLSHPQGSKRRGVSGSGRKWTSKTGTHMGHIRGTVGNDGEPVDVFIKPGTGEPDRAFVVDQNDESGNFDEHKVVLGAESADEARDLYNSNYPSGWDRAGEIREMPIGDFKSWLERGNGVNSSAPRRNVAVSTQRSRGLSQDAFTDSADTSAVEQLQSEIQAEEARDGVTPINIVPVTPKSNGQGLRARRAREMARQAFDVDVQYFRSDDAQAPAGAVLRSDPSRVYVNANSEDISTAIIGHEILHHIRSTDPSLYNELRAATRPVLGNSRQYAARARMGRSASRYELSADNVEEEMLADVAGEFMAEPGFIRELQAEASPSMFRKLANSIAAFLEKAIAKLSGRGRPQFMAEYVKDMEAARDAVKSALTQYGARRRSRSQEPVARSNQPRPRVQRKEPRGSTRSGDIQVSWEARPGRTTGVLPGIHSAPYKQQLEYQNAIAAVLVDENGNDRIAQRLGLKILGQVSGPGVWQGEVSPGMQNVIPISIEPGANNSEIPADTAASVRAYAAMMGYVLKQEGMGYHRPYYSESAESDNGIEIGIGRPLNPDEMLTLYDAAEANLAARGLSIDAVGFVTSSQGVRVISFDPSANLDDFRQSIEDSVESLENDVSIETFASEGDLIENDWEANQDGQDYQSEAQAAGRSDIFEWVAGVLEPEVEAVNKRFDRKYGWGRAPSFSRAARSRAGESGVDESRPGSSDGAGRGRQPVRAAAGDGRSDQGVAAGTARRGDEGLSGDLASSQLLAETNYQKKNAFFSGVVSGRSQQALGGVDYNPVVSGYISGQGSGRLAAFNADYAPRLGHFDDHIARSIPGFGEVQSLVGSAIIDVYGQRGARMLDIGGSEGNLDKSISKLSGGRVQTVVVDPNPDMRASYESGEKVAGSAYSQTAFGERSLAGRFAFNEGDTPIYGFDDSQPYDVIHEAMTFQFIDNDRAKHVRAVAEHLAGDGVAIFEEKFSDGPGVSGWQENEAQKDRYKEQYFDKSDLAAKAESVLVGMHTDQVAAPEMDRILANQFAHVVQFWSAGNFKGYVAGNDRSAVDAMVDSIGDTSSDYSVEATPRRVRRERAPTLTSPMAISQTIRERNRFNSRAKTRAPQIRKELSKEISALGKHIGVEVETAHPSQYFDVDYADRIEAAFVNGKIVLFAGNIATPERALKVLVHEAAGHYGMEQILGEDYEDALTAVSGLSGEAAEAARAEVDERYEGLERGSREHSAETLAVMAEHGDTSLPIMKRILAAVRRFLRSLGILRSSLTENDVLGALAASGRYVNGRGRALSFMPVRATVARKTPSFSVAQPTFYSQMGRVLSDKLPGRGPASKVLQQIQAFAKKGQFKPEELEYSGLEEWLRDQGEERVSKEQVLEALAERGTRIEETILGDGMSGAIEDWLENADAEVVEVDGMYQARYANSDYGDPHDTEEEAWESLREEAAEQSAEHGVAAPTEYKRYSTPGGSNYRETLLRLPASGQPETSYSSSHWSQENVVAHLRTSERKALDGKSALLIDEVQSDWHQEGRSKGYKQAPKAGEKTQADLDREQKQAAEAVADALKDAGFDEFSANLVDPRTARPLVGSPIEPVSRAASAFLEAEQRATAKRVDAIGRVPDAPFKKTWPLLAIKRAIRMAAENDIDRVAISTGEMNADRYKLTKHIVEARYTRYDGSETGVLSAYDREHRTVLNKPGLTYDDLHQYLGEEIADRLTLAPSTSREESGARVSVQRLEGIDLETGGEGMKSFYDDILPKAIGKYIKKWGSRVGPTRLAGQSRYAVEPASGAEGRYNVFDEQRNNLARTMISREEADAWIAENQTSPAYHSFDVTPEMKKAALEGQPMYSRQKTPGQAFSDRANARAAEYREAMAEDIEAFSSHIRTEISTEDPAEVIGPEARGIEGYYEPGENRIRLFAGNIHSAERAREVLRHEAIGHYGFEEIVGDQHGEILDQVRRLVRSSAQTRRIAHEVRDRYQGADPDSDEFAREVVAVMAEEGVELPLIRRVLNAIKTFLRRLGVLRGDISEGELRQLLHNAGRYMSAQGERPLQARPFGMAYSETYPTFYSAMARTLEEKLPSKGPANQMRQMIESFAKKGQIKPEEYEWSGLPELFDFLSDPEEGINLMDGAPETGKQTITKEQILDVVARMGVRLEEEVKQGESEIDIDISYGDMEFEEPDDGFIEDQARELYLEDARQEIADEEGAEDTSEIEDDEAMERAIEKARERYFDDPDSPQNMEVEADFGNQSITYQVTYWAGEFSVYRDQVIDDTLNPHDAKKIAEDVDFHGIEQAIREDIEEIFGVEEDDAAAWSHIARNPQDDYREILLTLPINPERGTRKAHPDPSKFFLREGAREYDSSHWDEPNVVAHTRFDTRQVRRMDGGDSTGRNAVFVHEIQSDWHQEGRKNGYEGTVAEQEAAREAYIEAEETEGASNNALINGEVEGVTPEEGSVIVKAAVSARSPDGITSEALKDAYEYFLRAANDTRFADPKIKESPQALAELEKHADLVKKRRHLEDEYMALKNGVAPAPFQKTWPILAIKRLIKLAVDEGASEVVWTTGALSDEVSKGKTSWFYDRNLPNDVKKYIKKWGGTLGRYNVNQAEDPNEEFFQGFTITPEMREAVSKGQALFSRPKKKGNVKVVGVDLDGVPKAAATYADGKWLLVTGEGIGSGIREFSTRPELEKALADMDLRIDTRINVDQNTDIPDVSVTDFQEPSACYMAEVHRTFRHYAQDKFAALKRVIRAAAQARGVDRLSDRSDAYVAEALFHGRARSRLDRFNETHVRSLLDELQKTQFRFAGFPEYVGQGVSRQTRDRFAHLTAVDAYLYARHAKEANRQLEQINPGERSMSGMTDAQAEEILNAFDMKGDSEAMQRVAQVVDGITQASRDLLVESGLETRGLMDAWEETYDYYVPLKGEPGTEGDSKLTRFLRGVGKGIDSRGEASQRRLGRSSPAQDILGNVVAAHYSIIRRAEKNRVAKAMLRFAQENRNEDLWEVDQPLTRRVFDPSQGLVVNSGDPNAKQQPNVFVARVNGIEHHIVFNEQNNEAMRIAGALKNLEGQQIGVLGKALLKLNMWLSAASTSLNPQFIVTNLIRDLQTAGINLGDTAAEKLKLRVLRDVPHAMGAIFSQEGDVRRRKEWGEMARYYREFLEDGGATGWMDAYDSMDDYTQKLKTELDRERPGTWAFAKRSGKNVFDTIARLNTSVENAVRLSAYVHSRKSGLSRDQAANIAKNLTVNFNRKGVYGTALNSWYLFYNASMQGSVRVLQAIKNSKRVQADMAGLVAFGMIATIASRLAAGDDDDGQNRYDAIPEYIKESNMIFMFPGGQAPGWVPGWLKSDDGSYMKIPMPYGYNVFYYMGQKAAMASMAAAGMVPGYNATQEAISAALAPANSFNPIGTGDPLQMVSPTILDPVVQWYQNKNWAGIPIMPEASPYEVAPPNYTLYFGGARSWSKWVTERANMISGGTDVEPGAINVSPETVDMVTDFFGGGVTRFGAEVAEIGWRSIVRPQDLKNLEPNNVPFVSTVYGNENNHAGRTLFYERSDRMRYLEAEIKSLQTYQKNREDRQKSIDKLEYIKQEYAREIKLLPMYRQVEKALREERKTQRRLEDDAKIDEQNRADRLQDVNDRQSLIYAKFNRAYKAVVLEGKDVSEHRDEEQRRAQ